MTAIDFQGLVREFHLHMGHHVDCDEMDPDLRLLRCRLITEEAAEFVEAAATNDKEAMVDALCDLLYVTFGTGVCMGIDLAEPFKRVHAANMRKTPAGPYEKPIKGENWAQERLV